MSLIELKSWIEREHNSGHSQEAIANRLIDMGWHADSARNLLRSALGCAGYPRLSDASISPTPGIDFHDIPTSMAVDDREIDILMFVRHPTIILFGNFLSDSECEQLISYVSPRLRPSKILDVENASQDGLTSYSRTSDSAMLDRDIPELVLRIEERAATLLNWESDRFEYMQVVRYRPGEEFASHHDYFDESFPATAQLVKNGGNRVGTLLIYLNTPKRGGSTIFTDIELEVMPQRGCALFFSYGTPHPLTLTFHGGAPVVQGEKWLATIFMRQNRHRMPYERA